MKVIGMKKTTQQQCCNSVQIAEKVSYVLDFLSLLII